MSGTLLDGLYIFNYDEMMRTLLLESRIFGVTIYGDGAVLYSSVYHHHFAHTLNSQFPIID
jgi:hypothetical protein